MSLSDKKTSGERLRIKAADWNAILDAARKVRENPYFNSETSPFLRQSSICKVKNESGSDQPRFAVLGLDEPIILPTLNEMEFKRQLTFRAVAPVAGTHEGKYAILLEPLADDAIGDAVISGVVPCKLAVNILDSVFGWAEIADGVTATLNNVKVGTARVLWAEDEGTERWALVRVADSSTGDPVVTQVTWTTDQTDYLLPADTTDLIIESMDAAHTLHSMISGHNGRTVRIHNASDYDLFLDSGTGTAGAWFSIASGETTRIMPGEGMTVTWTTTQDAWQIMDKPGVLVCDSAGTPVSVATDAIRFNEVQGVSVSKTDDNEATVGLLAASATQMGAVNTTAQTLAGQKVFSDGALFLEFTTHRSKTVTWSTDQTDYAIGDAARVLYVNATADVVLNSILFSGAGTTPDSGGEANARFLIIVNTNATYSLTLKHQASTGTAAERFYCDGAADIVLSYRQAAYGWYDPNLERHVWFKLGNTGGSGSVPPATTDGAILMAINSAWVEVLPAVTVDGYIVTNNEGLICAVEV